MPFYVSRGGWPRSSSIFAICSRGSASTLGSRGKPRASSLKGRPAAGGDPFVRPLPFHDSRCQRRSVCGLTTNEDHRTRGSVLLIGAMNKRSRRRRRGRPRGAWTISWWRSTTTSTSPFRSFGRVGEQSDETAQRQIHDSEEHGPNLHEQGANATNPLVAATIYELLRPSGKPAPAPRSRSPERGRSRPTEPA
jgi:hypothetical protein